MLIEKPTIITRNLAISIILLAGISLLFSFFNNPQAPIGVLVFLEKNRFVNLLFLFAATVLMLPERSENKWFIVARFLLSFLLITLPFAGLHLFSGNYTSGVFPADSDYNIRVYLGLTGLALFLILSEMPLLIRCSQILLFAVCIAAIASLLCYLFEVEEVNGLTAFIFLAPATAVSLILLCVRIVLSKPEAGLVAIFNGQLPGNYLMRALFPAAILLPAILGRFRLWGFRQGYYDHEFGLTIDALIFILLLIILLWYTARQVNKREAQRIEMENSLQQREQELQTIFKNAPDAIVVMDKEGIITKWNEAAEKIFGFTAAEVIGKSLGETIVPEDYRAAHNAGLKNFILTSNAKIPGKTIEMPAITNEQQRLEIAFRIALYTLEDKVYFVAFLRDITEIKTEEKKRRLAEQQFHEELSRQVELKTVELTEILERLTDGFIAVDKYFRFTYMNKKAGEMARQAPSSVIGKYLWDVFPDAVESDTHKAVHAAMQTQLYTVNVDYYEPLDIHIENYIYPSPNGLSIFIRNVSAKKRTERALQHSMDKYKTFVDEAQDAILVYSPSKGRYIDVNKKACELLGYDLYEMLQLKPADLVFEDDDVPSILPALSAGLAVRVERKLKRKDGTAVEVETSASKLPDGTFLAFTRNITDRKQTEKELLRLTTQFRELSNHLQNVREEERIHIAREIHDELGQQMTVMKMDMTWIRKNLQKATPEKLQERVEEVIDMVDRTVKTIRKIASELRPSLLDDIGLAAAMEWHLTEFEERTGIKINSSLPGSDIPIEDKVKTNLFRILQEALTNVTRHSKATEVNVLFEVNDRELFLKIEDNGIGFDLEQSNSKTLGLLGMKERTNMMGGNYKVTSKVGNGTTVTVSFPRQSEKNKTVLND
jgi:PAS domain S-box-containing protein